MFRTYTLTERLLLTISPIHQPVIFSFTLNQIRKRQHILIIRLEDLSEDYDGNTRRDIHLT